MQEDVFTTSPDRVVIVPYLGCVKGRVRLLYFVLICALYRIACMYLCLEICVTFDAPSDGVDRDTGGESGNGP